MQNLEVACKEAEKKLEKLKTSPLPLTVSQDNSNLSIFDKLAILYQEELLKNSDNSKSVISHSFLLEKLVTREGLNTLILNLYPEKNEYSFVLRMGSIVDDLNDDNDLDKVPNTLTDIDMEKISWQLNDEILRCIDNEEIPGILVDILNDEHPELFYSGCVIVEVRDYQNTNGQISCETRHVLLKPNTMSFWSDLNTIVERTNMNWTDEDKQHLESELIHVINPKLCLDPCPSITLIQNRLNFEKNILNTSEIFQRAQQIIKVPKKRKLETVDSGLNYITKKRLKSAGKCGVRMNLPAPNLEPKKALSIPKSIVNTENFKSFSGPKEVKNCHPVLIVEYDLDTDRICERDKEKLYHLHFKLSIFQRPYTFEYLGELYLDVDYEVGKSKGASSRFTLGSRTFVDIFIRQFIDMLTEKGRRSINIVKKVPGQEPRYIYIQNMIDKTVEAQQQPSVHTTAQQTISSVQLQGAQQQMLSGPSTISNGNQTPNVVLLSETQTNHSSVPILQAQLQAPLNAKPSTIHTTNPEITALVAGFISDAQQIEEAAAAAASLQQQNNIAIAPSNTNNNSTMLSLLNSAAPVNNNLNSNAATIAVQPQQAQKLIGRKMPGLSNVSVTMPRVLNHVPQQVSISALASQLAAPPVSVFIAAPAAVANPAAGNSNQQFTSRLVSPSTSISPPTTAPNLPALLLNTPAADHPIPNATINNAANTLFERITASSGNSNSTNVNANANDVISVPGTHGRLISTNSNINTSLPSVSSVNLNDIIQVAGSQSYSVHLATGPNANLTSLTSTPNSTNELRLNTVSNVSAGSNNNLSTGYSVRLAPANTISNLVSTPNANNEVIAVTGNQGFNLRLTPASTANANTNANVNVNEVINSPQGYSVRLTTTPNSNVYTNTSVTTASNVTLNDILTASQSYSICLNNTNISSAATASSNSNDILPTPTGYSIRLAASNSNPSSTTPEVISTPATYNVVNLTQFQPNKTTTNLLNSSSNITASSLNELNTYNVVNLSQFQGKNTVNSVRINTTGGGNIAVNNSNDIGGGFNVVNLAPFQQTQQGKNHLVFSVAVTTTTNTSSETTTVLPLPIAQFMGTTNVRVGSPGTTIPATKSVQLLGTLPSQPQQRIHKSQQQLFRQQTSITTTTTTTASLVNNSLNTAVVTTPLQSPAALVALSPSPQPATPQPHHLQLTLQKQTATQAAHAQFPQFQTQTHNRQISAPVAVVPLASAQPQKVITQGPKHLRRAATNATTFDGNK